MDEETANLFATSFILGLRVSQNINNLPDPDEVRYLALLETLDMFLSPLGNYCEMVITESECNPMSGLRGRRSPKPRQHTAFIRYVVMKEEKE